LTSEQQDISNTGPDRSDTVNNLLLPENKPKNWDIVEIRDLLEKVSSRVEPSDMDSQNYVSLKHMGKSTPRINEFGDAKEVSSQKYRFSTGDILFGKLRPYFRKVALARSDGICSTDINVIKPTDKISRDFLFYTLFRQDFIDIADKTSTGTRMPRADWKKLNEIKIALPPIDEQKKISEILYNIDTKIEINRQIREILQDMAQAIFNSRFVDFDTYTEFKQTEVGKIPVNFSIDSLEKKLSFQRGYSYTGDELIDEESELEPSDGYPMINLGTISPEGGYNEDGIKYCEELPKKMYRVNPGGLVISHTDMTQDLDILGSPVLVPELIEDEMLFSHHLYKIVDTDVPKEYLYFYFLSPYFKPKAENFASGTTVLSFSSKIASDVHIPIPPKPELNQYVEKVRPIFETKEEIRKENNRLAELRDTLLPKLMSSEVRVNDLELDDLEV
jgi:type I restriction enzyme S subunit